MQTYSEVEGEEPINWWKFLQELKEKEAQVDSVISEFETMKDKAEEASGHWITCACGNQCNLIPRTDIGAPEDGLLCGLGLQFSRDINNLNWDKAQDTLEQIEARSAYLINEINSAK